MKKISYLFLPLLLNNGSHMYNLCRGIFHNKPWSKETLLTLTLKALTNYKFHLLPVLNDIDEYEDLMKHPTLLQLAEKQTLNLIN